MASLKEAAMNYESKQTKNIADLEVISTDLEVKDETFTNSDNEEITIQVVEVDGETYRVPKSVLNSLKVLMEDNPDLKKFRVKKSGQGMETRYTVIPLV